MFIFTKASTALVVARHQFPKLAKKGLWITINPNPKTKMTVKRTLVSPVGKVFSNKRQTYGTCKLSEQYDYCIRYFKTTYLPYLSEDAVYVGTYELTKDGMVHLHIVLYDPDIQTEEHLWALRKNIMNEWMTIQNLAKVKNPKDFMNNIVYIDPSYKGGTFQDRIKYMDKDHSEDRMFLNFYGYKGAKCQDPDHANSPQDLECSDDDNDDDASVDTVISTLSFNNF